MIYRNMRCRIFIVFCGLNSLFMCTNSIAQSSRTSMEGYYTGDKIPGDLTNQVQIFKSMYDYVQIYRQRHEGAYPILQAMQDPLVKDISSNPLIYGLKSIDEYYSILKNPDNQYADYSYIRQNPTGTITSSSCSLRADGRELGAPKSIGTKDILSSTFLYTHVNSFYPGEVRKTPNPVGFYMVLWDDGSITKIAYDQLFYMPTTTSDGIGYRVVYPAQAGLPWNCLTYAEWTTGLYPHTTSYTPPIGYPLAPGQIEPKPDNGGIESLVQLTRLFGNNFQREPIWDSLGHQVKDFTLQEVADGAAKIDFPLKKKTITLDELQRLHTPAILYLSDAARIITMSTIDDNHAIIYDRGMTLNVSRAELAKRYSGEALISASVTASSALEADQPIRTLNFSSKDAEVLQNVKITNHGAKPISLLIERPLCGITDAKLSQENLAPGESANLELHFKWRTVLLGDHQSTFVTLKTDDPAQPRLQLGFDLTLAEAK